MARRTKEDAEATRHKLLDAAEVVFSAKGVTGASLSEVAAEAGVTRGAIYWHFKDKVDLFDAMMQRVTLPLEHALEEGVGEGVDALQRLRQALATVLRRVECDVQTRRVFEIAIYKMEFVGELAAVRERCVLATRQFVEQLSRKLEMAALQHKVALSVPLVVAARGLHAVFDGVLHAWLLNEGEFSLEQEGMLFMDMHLRAMGFVWRGEGT